jgi:hypothetical protein
MSSDTISAVQQSVHLVTRNSSHTQVQSDNQKPSRTQTGNTAGARDQVALATGSSRQSLDTLQRLGGIAGVLNATATQIRETGDGLKTSAKIVSQMGGELNRIIKNYPPFSIQDEERKKILMEYASLRKQIEELTVPPPPPPIYEKVDDMWQKLFAQQDGKVTTPALKKDSSDSAVQTATDQLSVTGDTISLLLTTIESSL